MSEDSEFQAEAAEQVETIDQVDATPEATVETVDAPFDGIEVPHTADERVDSVLAGLLNLTGAPVADHVAIYDQVHRGLRDCLADLEPASSTAVRR